MSDYNNGSQGPWRQGPDGQNQYPGGPGTPDPRRQDQPRPSNGYATVSMICGIFGILCLCCFAFPLAIIPVSYTHLSRAVLILGNISRISSR